MSLEPDKIVGNASQLNVSISFGDLMSLERFDAIDRDSSLSVSISFGDLMSLEPSWDSDLNEVGRFQSPLEI